eukprot:g27326.t1
MLNSSIASPDVPQRKTAMTSSEDRHKTRLIEYPSSSSTSPERRNYAMLVSAFNIFDDDKYLTKIFPMPPLHAIKQLPNLKQTIVCRKLPSLRDSIDHNTTQSCHGNLCKTCQIIDMDSTITPGNTIHHIHSTYS